MKRFKWFVFTSFLLFLLVLFINRGQITLRPWIMEESLDYPGYASGNDEMTAIITDSSQSIVVINNENELLYKLEAGIFISAELVDLDEENNLYVHDKYFGGAFEENTERILKFSPTGRYLGAVYEHTYKNMDFQTVKGKISALTSSKNALYFARVENYGFYLECLTTGIPGDSLKQTFFDYSNAYMDFSHCRINADKQLIVWTTKTGNILIFNFDGNLINEIIPDEGKYPFMAVCDDDYNIIYTDVINGEIVLIEDITGLKSVIYDISWPGNVIYYYINYKYKKLYASFSGEDIRILECSRVIYNSNAHNVIDSYYLSENNILAKRILFAFCIITAILLVLLLIWSISFLVKIKLSGVIKQIVLVGACIIMGAGISAVIIITEMQKQNIENTYSELEKISRIISASVDANFLTGLHSRSQFNDEEYMAMSQYIKTVFSSMQFEGKQVYLIIWMERDGIVYSMYDLEYSLGLFYPYGEYEDSFLQVVFESGEYDRSTVSDASGTWVAVSGPMYDNDGNIIASIETGYNIQNIEEKNREMLIQVALIVIATTIAFLLIVIECLIMFDTYRKNKNNTSEASVTEVKVKPNMLKYIIALLVNAYSKDEEKKETTLPDAVSATTPKFAGTVIHHLVKSYREKGTAVFYPEMLRAASFFLFFSLNFATALLPMYSASLYIPVFNLPREVVITLPFTTQVIFVVLSLLVIPNILGKISIGKTSLAAAVIFVTGNIFNVIADNVIVLSIGYSLTGFACGTFVLIFNTIIGSQVNASDVNSGFAHFNASYLAGINVGVVFGAIIAQFFPYRTVFWFATLIALLFLGIIVFSLRSKYLKHYYQIKYVKENSTEKFVLLKFIFKPIVLCTLLMALMPYVVSASFIDYFVPVFGTENGLGEANIGQLMLLSGLLAILFGAGLCKLVSKKMSILLITVVPLLLDAVALYLFSLNVSVGMMIVTIVILAIVNIFALTNIQTYYAVLYQKANVSSMKALGAFSVVENISMAIGPIVFSYILAGDISLGIKMLASIILGCAVLFVFVSSLSVKWNNKTVEKILK